MRIKTLLVISLFVLLVPAVYSLKQCGTSYCNDFVIKPSYQGNTTTYINDMVINIGATTERKAHLYRRVTGAIITPTGGGGSVVTLYYDVLVDVLKDRYKYDENVVAEIIFINKGRTPDRDGRLLTYLMSPDGKRYKEQAAEFELIPPTCPNSIYDWYEDLCADNSTPKKTIVTREVALPPSAKPGEWKFYAEYETRVQPLIKVWDSFDVYTIGYIILIIVIVVLIAYFIGKNENYIRSRRR